MSEAVLDASALLAVLNHEPGQAVVAQVLGDAAISAVNLAEVVSKMVERGKSPDSIRQALGGGLFTIIPFDEEQAYDSGLLRAATTGLGLSFGDRACLSLARKLGLPAYTAERAWARLDIGVHVRVVR